MNDRCTFEAENGKNVGWKPKYGMNHILEYAEEEVDFILNTLEEGHAGQGSRLRDEK